MYVMAQQRTATVMYVQRQYTDFCIVLLQASLLYVLCDWKLGQDAALQESLSQQVCRSYSKLLSAVQLLSTYT